MAEDVYCRYGCGRKGLYLQTTGRFCCERFYASCPAIREKNRNGNKGKLCEGRAWSRQEKRAQHFRLLGKNKGRIRLDIRGAGNPKFGGNKGEDNPMFGRKQSARCKRINRLMRLGKPSPNKGIPMSDEAKIKMSKARIGRFTGKDNPNFGNGKKISGERNPSKRLDVRLKLSVKSKERWNDPKYRKHMSDVKKLEWADKDRREKMIQKMILSRHIKPNKLESSFCSLLNTRFPKEWKYVGDGKVIIGGKCPDFINVNGQKKIIELFGDYWHKGQNPKDRIDMFKPYGYKTLVVWEKEFKDSSLVMKKVEKFMEKR
jgi:G:T-mismatch repair DNA endonuclease (very short patch repair protein)